jgi:hypothetical protein
MNLKEANFVIRYKVMFTKATIQNAQQIIDKTEQDGA